ncbi:hypothetical protein EXIGLDRAFT_768675 [Exidia glandulosa HHB12029]|uniref:Uncharacterized protein n=1 Tax=Exidia glandulosa HHB12029 TaxID=1314781 RepID=A0A165I191_EXIGL|nr:hypothetical protein EXIGLDRAFT_768675 [Exidia glandulosa HHB12029]
MEDFWTKKLGSQPTPATAASTTTSISVLSTPNEIAAASIPGPSQLPLQFAPGVFVAPTNTQNPLAGKSCIARYPHVEPAILQSVITHQLEFKSLYKLCARLTRIAPPTQSVNISASGMLSITDASVSKAFPDAQALTDSIATYLGICAFVIGAQHSASSGGFEHTWTINHGILSFTQLIHQLLPSYTWASVLAYAEQFYLSRRAEMAHGVYSGWLTPDLTLWPFLVPLAPGSAPAKTQPQSQSPRTRALPTPGVPIAQQVCLNYQQGRCPDPCRYGRVHSPATAQVAMTSPQAPKTA